MPQEFDPTIFEKAQVTMISALVQALVQEHPNPAAVYEHWKRFTAIGRTDWSTRAVALGVPGFGAAEMQRAYDELNDRLAKLVEQKQAPPG